MAERDARIVPALPPGTSLIGSTGLHDGAATLLAIGRADRILAPIRIGAEPLHADLKAQARVFPVVQRGGKGGAALSPGPSFERSAGALRETGTSLVFANLTNSVSGVLTPGVATWSPELEPDLGFVPVPDLGLTTGPDSAASTGEAIADRTPEERHDGSTPAIPRAVALSSTTPAPAGRRDPDRSRGREPRAARLLPARRPRRADRSRGVARECAPPLRRSHRARRDGP